jgi:predicted Zn-dependent protease
LLPEHQAKIALHELGHSLGLDHHSYKEDVDCVMIGDATMDCTETVDDGGIVFCNDCASGLRKKLRK